jgi:hypothetical protein
MTDEAHDAPEGVSEDTTAADLVAEDTGSEQGQSGDDAPAEDVEGEAEQPKPKKSAQERINELTRKAREAERDAEYWRSKATQPEPRQEPEPQGDGRPDPTQYADGVYDPNYVEDLTSWKADQTVTTRLAQVDSQRATRQAVTAFEAKTAELYPEGEPEGLAAFRRIPQVPMPIQDVILMSDQGPKLADHLGANPRELQRLSALPPHLQAYELAKVEARLTAPATPRPKVLTDAPEPAPQARGAGGKFKVSPDTDDFSAFEKAYLV